MISLASIRSSLTALLPASSFRRHVTVLAGGTALGQAITVLASPVLTRLYEPEDFGVLLVYSSILQMLLAVASLRYELAIPLPERDSDAANLLLLSIGIVAAMSVACAVGVFFAGGLLLEWTKTPALGPYLWLLPLGLLGAGLYQALSYWAIRKKEFAIVSKTRVVQSGGSVGVQIGFALASAGPAGLLLGYVASQALGSGSLAIQAAKDGAMSLWKSRIKNIPRIAQRYRRFPLISSPSSLINGAGLALPMILFAALYNAQVAGWLALGQRVVNLPMILLGNAVAQVFLSEGAQLARTDPTTFMRLFRRTGRKLITVGFPPMLFLLVASPALFALIFGENWREAGRYVQFLSVGYFTQFVAAPLSQTLNLLERQDLQFAWDIARLVLSTGALALSFFLDWSANRAIAAYAASMAMSYVLLFLFCDRCTRKLALNPQA